jgi:cytidylate kinase
MSDVARSSPQELPEHNGGEESPRHGFRGSARPLAEGPRLPAALTIALSREAGARGTSIARRVGEKLGWQVYTQDMLEYLANQGNLQQEILEQLSPPARAWVEEQLARWQGAAAQGSATTFREIARLILALAVQGEVILIGRGAGLLLPPATTLHVRIYAPLAERIAYMSQWLRLTTDEARQEVLKRDERRNHFVDTHFHYKAHEPYRYDLLLNSSLLGEELCAELIVHAARGKQDLLARRS